MERYCQMLKIGAGIRCDQQPPADDCCNLPARDYIVVWGEKQWLCARHYDEHVETRGLFHMAARVSTRTGIRCDPHGSCPKRAADSLSAAGGNAASGSRVL
jgi:hypothetical protein